MEIKKLLTPYNHNRGISDRIKYIVIHYVGAIGGAEANCKYYAGGDRGASAHYFVDFDGTVWQSVDDQNIAWHCGAKAYIHPECRNANSIGIEMCVRNEGNQADTSNDWYFEDATVAAAIALTKELMKKYNIPADHVLRHYDVTGKICPNPYVYNHTKHTWEAFKAAITVPKEPEGWVHDSTGWWYRKADGTWLADKWEELEWNGGKSWYYFDSAGYMIAEAWKKTDEKWYYLGKDGAMVKDCVIAIKNECFAFGSDGAMMMGNIQLKTNERGVLLV